MIKPLTGSTSIGSAFNKGLQIYKENFVLIFLGYLIACLVSGVTCGICSGPMMCGFIGILLSLLRNNNPKPQVSDLFNGFQKFLPAFVTMLAFGAISFVAQIVNIIPILGQLAAIVIACFILPAVMLWALFFVQDQNATIGEAIVEPLKLVTQKPFWTVMLVVFVAGLLGAVGCIACGIGVLFTMPLSFCMVAAAYEEVYGDSTQLDVPAAASPAPPAL
ncbi:MAG: hypothetical protein IKP00_15505 [Victivallales bacterium]|nr:hypothetical protein [Victivallales bacterium]